MHVCGSAFKIWSARQISGTILINMDMICTNALSSALTGRDYDVILLWESTIWAKTKSPNLWFSSVYLGSTAEFSLISSHHDFCLGFLPRNLFIHLFFYSLIQYSFTHSKHSFPDSLTCLITHSPPRLALLHYPFKHPCIHSNIHIPLWQIHTKTLYLPSEVNEKFLDWIVKLRN